MHDVYGGRLHLVSSVIGTVIYIFHLLVAFIKVNSSPRLQIVPPLTKVVLLVDASSLAASTLALLAILEESIFVLPL